jgi:DNA-binding NarL/FixJ family response regulator
MDGRSIIMKILLQTPIKKAQLTKATEEIVSNGKTSKSSKMKDLFNLGYEVGEISKLMDVRYNFVYNVVSNYVITNGIEVVKKEGSSKKDKVWALLDEGKTVKEIAIELKTNYNYVYKLRKDWIQSVEEEVKSKKEAK